MRLAGQSALVTGAGQGIGAAIASALAAEGSRVAVADLNVDAAEQVAAKLGGSGIAVGLDVRDRASVERAAAGASEQFGELTVLVNNAGITRVGPSESLPEEDWQEVIDVNLSGPFRCCQVIGARMLAAGHGSIVNIASISAEFGMPSRAAYCATKSALIGLTRVLAVEWAGRGVRVNAVEPGYVRTPLIADAIEAGLLAEEEMLARTPTGRLAEPEDIARAVVFLSSAEAAYITGQTLVVDGGYLAYGAAAPASRVPTTAFSSHQRDPDR